MRFPNGRVTRGLYHYGGVYLGKGVAEASRKLKRTAVNGSDLEEEEEEEPDFAIM